MTLATNEVVERESAWDRVRAARLETKLAVASLLATALHVLDDNVFQRPRARRLRTTS
jgi:hypothetical protein